MIPGPADVLVHAALTRRDGVPLGEARLTDRRRLAVVLQGAALLAHLDHAGWHLAGGFGDARLAAEGLLLAGELRPGRSREPAQELLRDLLARLFGDAGGTGEVAGRGEARRAARELLDRWHSGLAPIPPDAVVAQVLEAAPFLWEPSFAAARLALAGEHRQPDRVHLWVAGPGHVRSRLLARCRDLASLSELLAGTGAREAWDGEEGLEPRRLAAAGRCRAAVAAWARTPPVTAAERLELARALVALGRSERALEVLADARSVPARTLKVRCQLELGRLGAAKAALWRLEEATLSGVEVVELAELAAPALANAGEAGRAAAWVERALTAARGVPDLQPRAELVAALAAWDRGDLAAMDRHLAAARPLAEGELGWQWHQARGLRTMSEGDGPGAVAHLARALAGHRRILTRRQAAGLWNDLGLGRAEAGDLAGAERAFLHAARLMAGGDGPRTTTLALTNLAEIRTRRGRFAGVREILEQSTAENRLAGNVRGLTQDHELWARFELAQGRPAAALALCRGAVEELARHRTTWRRAELAVLAARALGWLGRAEEAAAELARSDGEAARSCLEPEELPALWAHAGRREEALRAAAGTPAGALWQGALTNEEPAAGAWEALARLEPYRAARLVFDLELAAPGAAPPHWRRRAAAVLRRAGAGLLAERLEARDHGAWRALGTYFEGPAEPAALARLLAEAGYPEAELSWTGPAEREVLAGGRGTGEREELSAPVGSGLLVLAAPEIDPALAALFALARRDLDARLGGARPPAPPPATGGMVGESPGLRAALERLARLAPSGLAVLVLGESGTGKELVARELHRRSPRARAPFVAVNCAALSETLQLSDLFGHVRGSFTGADRDRAGVFEAAQGGTVFLDEIGDLPLIAQGLLLRVLQEGEVRRVGESLPRRVDVRVVAATHRDLARMVREGSFRQDLFYRLRGAAIELPPLRERGQDVLLIAGHLLAGRHGAGLVLSRDAQAKLLGHPWPGNVRELQNVLAVATALAGTGPILPRHLELEAGDGADEPAGDYHRQVNAFRRRLITKALTDSRGSRAEAARQLGLSRQALSYLARQLRIELVP